MSPPDATRGPRSRRKPRTHIAAAPGLTLVEGYQRYANTAWTVRWHMRFWGDAVPPRRRDFDDLREAGSLIAGLIDLAALDYVELTMNEATPEQAG